MCAKNGLGSPFYSKKTDAKGSKLGVCNDCQFGCEKFLLFWLSRKSNVLDFVHSNVCSMLIKSLGGGTYFISFIDEYSRKIWVYLLKHKSDAFDAFKSFHAFVPTQKGTKLKYLRADNGGEFTSTESKSFCDLHDIVRAYRSI
jgi:hypothetical protein